MTVNISKGTRSELKAWRDLTGAIPMSFFRDVTHGWQDFWWAKDGSRPIGIVWVVGETRLLRLQPNDVAIVDLYTLPEVRGRGVGKALLATACHGIRQLGATRMYATVEIQNLASRRVFEALGFSIVGHLTVGGVLKQRFSPTYRVVGCLEGRG